MSKEKNAIGKVKEHPEVIPRPVDVLCGRGGMSNHHPGNEWYRRLIRSNRPLYRACPKHTKLLVAKAIVQAVEQQDGRFLEREKHSGDWCRISYKRAVDKTSQGLREKDREVDTDDIEKKGALLKRENDSGLTGRNTNRAPTLEDMTKGVIVRANSASYFPEKRFQISNNMVSGTCEDEPISVPVNQIKLLPKQGSIQKNGQQQKIDYNQPSPQQLNSVVQSPSILRRSQTDDFTPLPPTTQFRQSSMFLKLQGTALLPNSNNETSNEAQSRISLATQTGSQANIPNRPDNSSQQGNHVLPMMVPLALEVPQELWQQQPSVYSRSGLSQFTSQMSDWLNTFWPTPSEKASPSTSKTGFSTSVEQVLGSPASSPDLAAQQQKKQVVTESASSPASNTTREKPPVKMIMAVSEVPLDGVQKHRNSLRQVDPDIGSDIEDCKPAARSSRKSNKRKCSYASSMPALPYCGESTDNNSSSFGEEGTKECRFPLDGMPLSDLEHSVSATLLQLASSPTRLMSDISSYFVHEVVMDNKETKERGSNEVSNSCFQQGDSKRSKLDKKRNSLLDDYEETPMEARMRQVQYA